MAWRDIKKIASILRACIDWENPQNLTELLKVLRRVFKRYSEGIAKELADLEKRIHDLERRGR